MSYWMWDARRRQLQCLVRCMHELTRQFDGIGQNAAPSDSSDERWVQTPVAFRLLDASKQPVVLRWQNPEQISASATLPAARSASRRSISVRPER